MKAGTLNRWLLSGELRAHPWRSLVALLAIALGVGLGFAIHLINGAAFNEFSAAARSLSGQADLQVRASQAWFDEALWPRLAQWPGVEAASPVLEVDAALAHSSGSLKVLGVDVMRSAAITPELLPYSEAEQSNDLLLDDTVFLSSSAMQWLGKKAGDSLVLRTAQGELRLRIAGGIRGTRPGQRLAMMDLGAAQWRLGHLGQLSRIDLKLKPGVDLQAFQQKLQAQLPPGLIPQRAQDQQARTERMSRAYRVNLNVLALVALFTGAYLVFSTQALSVIRRRSQFALLRVLGLTRRQLLIQVLLEGKLLGVLGSLLGLAGGYAVAVAALRLFGGDLGGGYFPGVQPQAAFEPVAALIFFCAGTAVAVLGSLAPAWEAARMLAAPALKAGSEDTSLSSLSTPWPGVMLLIAGAALTRLPAVGELPIPGYISVALLLIGAIALMPRVAALLFSRLAVLGKRAVPMLALNRLANAPNQASIALGGVLCSFSLMVAMAIMVASLRVSVDDWLRHLLAADLYVRASAGEGALLTPQQQQKIQAVPGVTQVGFQRVVQLTLDPARPTVALIARLIDEDDPAKSLPLVGEQAGPAPARAIPVWGSEAMVDLYGWRVGQVLKLPLGQTQAQVIVAGIWRDYVRQSGGIQMRFKDYQQLTGDDMANDAALWLARGTQVDEVQRALRQLPFGPSLEITQPGDIRALSLKIFDRSFAVTYLLEGVAILIGLFGIAATFSAQTLARMREFGMLRHLGVSRGQIMALLASEGLLLTAIGVAFGGLLGWCISLVLIYIVNPQSFHWTMQFHVPWTMLGAVTLALLLSAVLTALLSGRLAISGEAVKAVRDDW